jgi:hypothetical protein
VPLLLHGAKNLIGLPPLEGFRLLARLSAVSLLFFTFAFLRSQGFALTISIFSMAVVAGSFYQVKFPLFFSTLVDIEAYVMMILGMWSLFKKKYLLTIVLSSIGVFFKEFLIIPSILLVATLVQQRYYAQSPRYKVLLLCAIIIPVLCAITPRILLPINDRFDFQEFHRNPPGLRLKWLVQTPLDYLRDINLVFSWLSFLLPIIILGSKERLRLVWKQLAERRWLVVLYFVLVFGLTMYGGTNTMIFVTYAFVGQILVLSVMIEGGIAWYEVTFLFISLVIYNRLWSYIPLPADDFYGFVELYGGWSSLVTPQTLYRFLELFGFILGGIVLRTLYRRNAILSHLAT